MASNNRGIRHGQRGGALLTALFVVVIVSAIAAAIFAVSMAQKKEVSAVADQTRALYLAESGISEAALQIATSVNDGNPAPTSIGSESAPVGLKGGSMWCTIVDNGDETYTVTSTGTVMLSSRTLEAVVVPAGTGIFDHAIFAGNSSEDPAYTLHLSGTGSEADLVTGNIYSGGDVLLEGDAQFLGDLDASGTITGGVGNEGVTRAIPDISGMDYGSNHDFDVASLFATATFEPNALGGSAWQLPESNPAHIFRKNPNNRRSETEGTVKDDYFLEDPHEAPNGFAAPNGRPGANITLSGTMGAPGASGTDKVYFIDGNLWLHNTRFLGVQFLNTDAQGAKVTFVVKGNVYFSDDVHLGNSSRDGVAFIAIADEEVEDSGNIYLGDPRYGTLEHMQAYLYAENDFYDYNLDEEGAARVEIIGNMTAGNHVAIERDFEVEDGRVVHSKLMVQFDDRISTGAIELPGLPQVDDGIAGYRIAYWRDAARP